MFLKSLTLRGFKSFADKTALDFEPGVTVIVGPNGSGKSNIVDALAWVLGSHSPKSLRGSAMSDVIFAGAPGKAALGRASVEITIDNADGILPIEFSEVTVSRAMYASGDNEYAINGVGCRLLDVQELLSDTGLGRENHTIVGQGQLDAILNAKPEDRRLLIDEAAGILKHRRRKERAVRKLTQMEAHLERLGDVVRELRRTLRPLERQAEAAEKHASLQAQLREARFALAIRELDRLDRRWRSEEGTRARADGRLRELETTLAGARDDEQALERQLAALTPIVRAAAETHFRLANLSERYRGLAERIEERRAGLLEVVEEPVAGRDPAQLRARATAERELVIHLDAAVTTAAADLEEAEESRRQAEHALRAHERASAAEARRRTQAREARLRWEGEVSALRSTLAQAGSEEGRLASQRSGLEARRAELQADRQSVQAEVERLEAARSQLAGQLSAAQRTMEHCQAVAERAVRDERELERRRASLEARADALRAASEEAGEGARTLSAAARAGEVDGVIGPLVDQVRVADGLAPAIAAALGPLGDALVVASPTAAADAVGFVRSHRSGRVLLLVEAGAEEPADPDAVDLADDGARPLLDGLRAAPGVLAALRRALGGVYVVDGFSAACALAQRHPGLTFVTEDGDLAGARGYAGGSSGGTTAVVSRAAAEEALAQLEVVAGELQRAHRQVEDADGALATARRDLDAAQAAMQECDGALTAAAERLNRLRKELTAADRERAVIEGQQSDLAREVRDQRQWLTALEARGVDPVADEPDAPDLEAERLDDELQRAREREVQARLALRSAEQRRDEVGRRVAALESEAADVEHQLAERETRRRRRLAAIERCAELAAVAEEGLRRSERSLTEAVASRDRHEEERAAQQRRLGALRARLRDDEVALSALRDARHEEELRRQELRHAVDAVRQRLAEEFDAAADEALAAARAEGSGLLDGDEQRDAELEERAGKLVRKIGLLGTVNPLALDELAAVRERHRFLTEQIEDLRSSRRDLLEVVEAVDDKIREVFGAAFGDVARQFERVFALLFPGGTGRLVLTAPDDLLETGVEVEARPPGKRVKRLSLLSGGERSLTALAVLFAIFAARPSPFYVLDEVEAALDDVNLQRFLGVVREFRASSQLLVVTHQKRTMEVADTLYGVSMQQGGVSRVISQRMDALPVSA